MTLQIDDAFIRKWHPKYDETEDDEADYKDIVLLVSDEVNHTEQYLRKAAKIYTDGKRKGQSTTLVGIDTKNCMHLLSNMSFRSRLKES